MADSQDTTNALEEAIQQLLDGIKEPYYSLATHMCDEFGRNKADREIHKSLLTFADGLDAQASRLPEDERWKLEGQSRDLRERAAALSNHHAESRTRRALMNKPVAA